MKKQRYAHAFLEGQLVYDWRRQEVFPFKESRDGFLAERGELREPTAAEKILYEANLRRGGGAVAATAGPGTVVPMRGEGTHGAEPKTEQR